MDQIGYFEKLTKSSGVRFCLKDIMPLRAPGALLFDLHAVHAVIEGWLAPLAAPETIFTFAGPLGVGKTTLVREFLHSLGVQQKITSPTFGYVNTYESSATGAIFYHFDLYRVHSFEQFCAAGLLDYFQLMQEQQAMMIIEWPEVIQEPLLSKYSEANKVHQFVISYVAGDPTRRSLEEIKSIES